MLSVGGLTLPPPLPLSPSLHLPRPSHIAPPDRFWSLDNRPGLSTSPVKPLLDCPSSNPFSFPKQILAPLRPGQSLADPHLETDCHESVTLAQLNSGACRHRWQTAAISTPAPTYRLRHRTKFKAASITSCHATIPPAPPETRPASPAWPALAPSTFAAPPPACMDRRSTRVSRDPISPIHAGS